MTGSLPKWMARFAVAFGLFWLSPAAHASFVLVISQSGTDVVANGSGTLNLTGLAFFNNPTQFARTVPSSALVVAGLTASADDYQDFSYTSDSFGPGNSLFVASSATGDIVGFGAGFLIVPHSYVSGNPLSDTATWQNQTLGSLGLAIGTYQESWGTDNFTLVVLAPEPSSLLLLGAGVLAFVLRRRIA
jgi:hypothetical protein